MLTPFILSAFVVVAPQTAAPVKSLPKASLEAIQLLLQDEQRAEALYAAVIQKHRGRCPFSNIIEAERCHQGALEGLLESYGLPVPANPWKDRKVEVPATFKAACEAGVQAEIENVALYDRLMKTVKEPDLLEVFERLRWASQERHLPAFRRHAER